MRKLVMLLPAYNEEAGLEQLVEKIVAAAEPLDVDLTIVIGNDGSSDRTPEIAEALCAKFPVEELRHTINRGLGETSRDLFERAAELCDDDDIIMRMDGDDTHDPKYMGPLIEKLDEGFDVVITSRFQPGGGQKGVGAYRGFISRCANIFMKCVFPIRGVKDYSCGYRAYRGAIIRRAIREYGNAFIQLKGFGFTCTLEKLVKLNLLGARFAEIPFMHRYDLKQSSSKMVTSVTTLGYMTMAVLHHWPWSGWRKQYGHLRRRAT